jgi:hypothetical protein
MSEKSLNRFPARTLAAVHKAQIVGLRAGRKPHRVIGLWIVVVRGRVFIRSWRVSRDGWFSVLRKDPTGILTLGDRAIKVSAIHTRSEDLKRLVSQAYAEKYNTPGSRKYVKDFGRQRSRDATIELVPRKRAATRRPTIRSDSPNPAGPG